MAPWLALTVLRGRSFNHSRVILYLFCHAHYSKNFCIIDRAADTLRVPENMPARPAKERRIPASIGKHLREAVCRGWDCG